MVYYNILYCLSNNLIRIVLIIMFLVWYINNEYIVLGSRLDGY